MGTPHKHAAVIKAWADGAEIEWREPSWTSWVNATGYFLAWNPGYEYRVKPEPHPQQDLVDAVKRGELGIQVKWPQQVADWVDVDGPHRTELVFPPEAQLRRRHKWQKEIDAAKAGMVIQYRTPKSVWCDWPGALMYAHAPEKWSNGYEFRIKPEQVVKGVFVWRDSSGEVSSDRYHHHNLKLTFEDGKLVAAEVI